MATNLPPRIYTSLKEVDAGYLAVTQLDNIYRPIRDSQAVFVPTQFGGLLNQQNVLASKIPLSFLSISPGV